MAQVKQEEIQLKIRIISPRATIPKRATQGSIGYDLYASSACEIPVSGNGLVGIGLAMTPPRGSYIRIAPRSGLALNKGIQVGAGVIDPDYTGEIKVLLFNQGKENFEVKVGDKIAQVIIEQALTPNIEFVNHLKPSVRGDKGFGSTSKPELAATNICDSNHKTSKYQKINAGELITMSQFAERPPGCSFIGSKPTSVMANFMEIDGPTAEIIIDSGSDITLMSQKLFSSMPEEIRPKTHLGKKINLSQVTSQSFIQDYVGVPLFFKTPKGPVSIYVIAYVVKGMTTPFILGNDYADQYSLSIERKEGESTLHFGETGRSMKISNSVSDNHLTPEVKAFLSVVKKKRHKIANKMRQKEKKQRSFFTVKDDHIIPPFTSKFVTIRVPWLPDMKEVFLSMKDANDKRLAPLQILDSIIARGRNTIMVINPTDCPITLKDQDSLGTVLDLDLLDKQVDPYVSQGVVNFTNLAKTTIQSFKKSPGGEDKEQDHAEKQEEQLAGPKNEEVPEFEFIPKEKLISSLDINPKLTPEQRKAVEKVLVGLDPTTTSSLVKLVSTIVYARSGLE